MEKKTNKVSYSVSLVFNPSMPKTLRTEEKKVQVYNKTTHKMEDKILPAQKAEDTPFSVPGVLYVLEKAGIKLNKSSSDYGVIVYTENYEVTIGDNLKHSIKVANKNAYKEARSKIMTKIDELKKLLTGHGVVVVVHSVPEDRKPKKIKKSSSNTNPGASKAERKLTYGKFGPSDKKRMPRKTKKTLQKDTVRKVLVQVGEMEGLSMSQLKRKKHHDTIVDFVNAWCNKDFKSYAETMRFIRNNRNKSEVETKIAA